MTPAILVHGSYTSSLQNIHSIRKLAAYRTKIREHPSGFGYFGLIKNLEEFCFEADTFFVSSLNFSEDFNHCFSREILVIFFNWMRSCAMQTTKIFFSFESYSCPAPRIARGIEILRKILTKYEGYSVCSFWETTYTLKLWSFMFPSMLGIHVSQKGF